MTYNSLLPKGIDGEVRNVRIKQYHDWKGQYYVPKRMAKAISWSSKTPYKQGPMEMQSEWKIIKQNNSESTPAHIKYEKNRNHLQPAFGSVPVRNQVKGGP